MPSTSVTLHSFVMGKEAENRPSVLFQASVQGAVNLLSALAQQCQTQMKEMLLYIFCTDRCTLNVHCPRNG